MKKTASLKAKKETTFIQKFVDFAQRISQNKFVGSIMEGFILVMPIIIASTIFILIQNLPASFGRAPEVGKNKAFDTFTEYCGVLYNLSYGLLGMALAITVSSRMAEKISPNLKTKSKLNVIIICISTMIAYMMLSVITFKGVVLGDEKTGDVILFEIFGAKGIFIAMITGLTVPWIFYFCYKFNVTIRLPKQVPQNISQAFLNIFPLLITMLIYGLLGFIIVKIFDDTILNFIFNSLEPLIKGANQAWFFILWSLVLALTWFIGIHTSVWSGITDTLASIGVSENIDLINNGQQATNLWVNPFAMGAYSMGETGAQIAIPVIILLLCKSKQLKSIAMVAFIPIMFQVNEPILFGLPSILNPLMMVPFLLTPIINSSIGVIFVNILGMNSSFVQMPWSMPTLIALPLSTGLDWLSFILPIIWFSISFLIWTPFILLQDNMYYKKEMQGSIKDEEFVDFRPGYVYIKNFFLDKAKHNEIKLKLKDQKDALINAEELANMKVVLDTEKTATPPSESKISKKVLVVCIGAGTSAMVAENINKVFENNSKYKIKGAACSQGNYSEFISTTDLVIISPQAKTIEKDLRAIEQSRNDFHVWQTKGTEFIQLLQDKKYTEKNVLEKLEE